MDQRNTLWPYPRLVAHRGGGVLAPENTRIGFETAKRHGVRMMETDAMLTKDGVAVLSHDAVLGRAIRGVGRVAELTYDEIKGLDAGVAFDARYAGEPVWRLEEAVAWAQANDVVLNVEIKPTPGTDEETARAVCAVLTRHYAQDDPMRPLLSSFSVAALSEAQRVAPHLPRGLLLETANEDWVALAKRLAVVSVHPAWGIASEAFVASAHANGWGVMCYTVNETKTASTLLAMGVDAVCTDRYDLFDWR